MIEPTICSCGAAIFKLRHVRTGNTAPILATPRDHAQATAEGIAQGNITIDLDKGTYSIVPKAERAKYEALYINHFADCPDAEGWHLYGGGGRPLSTPVSRTPSTHTPTADARTAPPAIR